MLVACNQAAVERFTVHFNFIELLVRVLTYFFYDREIDLAALKVLGALGAKHCKLGFAAVEIESK